MRHDIRLSGFAFGLRPVTVADASFIFSLRTDPDRGRFLSTGGASVEMQRKWIEEYYQREGDWYWLLHELPTGVPEGLAGIYGLSDDRQSAEWGRWVLRPNSAAAIESAWLVYRCAFEVLGLKSVVCRTLASNAQTVSFHDSCGLERAPQSVSIEVSGHLREAVEHRLHADSWPEVGGRLARLAKQVASRLRTGVGGAS